MIKEKKPIICSIIFIVVAIVITGIVYHISQENKGVQEGVFVSGMITVTEQAYQSEQPSEKLPDTSQTNQVIPSVEPEKLTRNCCYVCGAVQNPGVYEFEEGTRLDEVIALAGGFAKDAATDYLNLAKAVCDSEKIYVPTVDELAEYQLKEAVIADANNSTELTALEGDTEDKVNLNTADIEELTTLPGIGTAKANSILSYREEHGKFQTIEELKNIDGIKEGVFQKIADLIVVQ